ncbi:MAG TPA: pyruvate dehydrogenase complex dihydrolipoamide acetyltransferase, partial [Alphaproteobacteria bacterium]|nr:pyruvate dehydrogenase complex dihydrolipoamide acetyltransferase [Alphaproteobacteria bacterium]
TEGKLSKWLVKEGDVIKSGKVLCEIETDKATMEVEAVDEGTLIKIVVPEGTEGVAVNSVIAALGKAGETYEMKAASAVPTAAAPAVSASPSISAPPMQRSAQPQQMVMREGRIAASPLAKRIAQERGVNLYSVIGTGPNGRIVKEDVLNAISQTQDSPAKLPTAAQAVPAAQAGPNAKQLADLLGQKYTEIKNSPVRKVVAKRLTESKQTVPHFYLTVDCELDALLAARAELNKKENAKVSVNDFIMKATALALKENPAANAAWTDEAIIRYTDIDISVAVATPDGLITPIVKAADTKSLLEISAEIKDLAARARDNKLKPQEFQGGGFTVSNLGMFGIKHFGAIINPPQGCILAVGAGEKRAVVKDDKLAIATVMSVTLSVDHRVVDGAVGAEFTAAFKKLIESPEGWAK